MVGVKQHPISSVVHRMPEGLADQFDIEFRPAVAPFGRAKQLKGEPLGDANNFQDSRWGESARKSAVSRMDVKVV